MKRIALLLVLVLALTLTACDFLPAVSNDVSGELLTREEAIAAALNQAGLSKSDVWDLDAELDREWGKSVWEVDFDSGTQEYSFVLDAKTGELLHQKTERD